MDTSEKIDLIVANSNLCVLYQPVSMETDPEILPFNLPNKRVVVPVGLATNPKIFGSNLTKEFGSLNGVILIPGRQFDKFGGRHGKGWGWYDRFLSVVPAKWIRVGICSQNEFSTTRLVIQEWDKLMDWIIINDNGLFIFHETLARVSPSRYGSTSAGV